LNFFFLIIFQALNHISLKIKRLTKIDVSNTNFERNRCYKFVEQLVRVFECLMAYTSPHSG